MTVYSGTIQNRVIGRVYFANLAIILAIVGIIGANIIISNINLNQRYKLTSISSEYKTANASINISNANSSRLEDVDFLLIFARKAGMVENNESAVIYQDSGVAYDVEKDRQN